MLLYVTALVILLLDQASKLVVQQTLTLHESIPIIPGLFDLTYVLNPGAAFGFLSGRGEAFRNPFFIGISILAILLILFYHHKYGKGWYYPALGLALILGGATGNLIDRVRIGKVVDFLDFHIFQYHWPAFNLADASIVIGAGLLLLEMLRDWRSERGGKKAENEAFPWT